MINESQRDQITKLVEETIEAGATVELEGRTEGNVIHPRIQVLEKE